MAIAHVCLECGFDMARTRAHHDADYQLWLVRCPRCRTAAVRRPNAINGNWHRFLRLDIALSILLVQLLVAAALLTFARLLIGAAVENLDRVVTPEDWDQRVTAWCLASVIAALLTGMWLTAAFGHVRQPLLWLGWGAVVWCSAVIFPVDGDWLHGPLDVLWSAVWFAGWLTAFMVLAMLGILPGRALQCAHRWFRRIRWRARRRRSRRWRARL